MAQITTTGSISGTLNYQIFPLGEGANQVQKSMEFVDGELLCLVMASWTSAVFATVLASQRALATAMARCLLVVTIAMGSASSMKTTTAFATARTSVFPAQPDERRQLQVDCGGLGPCGCCGTVYRFYVEANDATDKISRSSATTSRPW